jgi:hypothetical protein
VCKGIRQGSSFYSITGEAHLLLIPQVTCIYAFQEAGMWVTGLHHQLS